MKGIHSRVNDVVLVRGENQQGTNVIDYQYLYSKNNKKWRTWKQTVLRKTPELGTKLYILYVHEHSKARILNGVSSSRTLARYAVVVCCLDESLVGVVLYRL
jgi:hypothetical protein